MFNALFSQKVRKDQRTVLVDNLPLKELRNCILRTVLVWPLFCLIQVYVGLYFLQFFWKTSFLSLHFLCFFWFGSNFPNQEIKIVFIIPFNFVM